MEGKISLRRGVEWLLRTTKSRRVLSRVNASKVRRTRRGRESERNEK